MPGPLDGWWCWHQDGEIQRQGARKGMRQTVILSSSSMQWKIHPLSSNCEFMNRGPQRLDISNTGFWEQKSVKTCKMPGKEEERSFTCQSTEGYHSKCFLWDAALWRQVVTKGRKNWCLLWQAVVPLQPWQEPFYWEGGSKGPMEWVKETNVDARLTEKTAKLWWFEKYFKIHYLADPMLKHPLTQICIQELVINYFKHYLFRILLLV